MRLLLIDGYYYVYRSFFAIRGLSNSRGEPTNAIYGFIKTVRKMLKDLAPDFAAVVWDEGLPERRTQLQPRYKQQRAEMPSDLAIQLDAIHDIVPLIGLPSLSIPSTEADDLMASYTVAARALGHEVILATNDKDLFQLTGDGVWVYSTNKADLASPSDPHALLGEAAVLKKWGVPPPMIGDILALIGDSVDNIPGVPGVGLKTAATLLVRHGGLDRLLENPNAIANEKLREKFRAALDLVRQNREMVRLDLDLPLPVPIDRLKIVPRYPEWITAMEKCEFKGLTDEVRAESEKLGLKGGQGEFLF
ncbi:MAG TPA: 5'-3' exonuclease H3TH domain-containing protein [Chthoniobacterales bacterium]